MSSIKVVSGINLQNGGARNACFRQGDLDGACGIYAATTAAVATGQISREDAHSIWSTAPDGRTAFAKALLDFGPLVQDGIASAQLVSLIKGLDKYLAPPNQWKPSTLPIGRGKPSISAIISYIDTNDLPVIVGLDWEGKGAHWSVAIGYTCSQAGGPADYLLFIDPGFESSRVQLWNATLNLDPKPGPKPYFYQTQGHEQHDSYCQVSSVITF